MDFYLMTVHSVWVLSLSHQIAPLNLVYFFFSLLLALKLNKMGYPITKPEFLDTQNLWYLEFWVAFWKTQITRPKISGNLKGRD
jgi:hypothetical protein